MEEEARVAEEAERSVEAEEVRVGGDAVDEEGGVELLHGVDVSADTSQVECWREWQW